MDFIGNALKCYEGHFFNKIAAQPIEPKLVDCKRNEDTCVSSYAKTNITDHITSEDGFVLPAGSWDKHCFKKSDLHKKISDFDFGNGESDRCIEQKREYVKVCKINP